jgi:hypothetical protein
MCLAPFFSRVMPSQSAAVTQRAGTQVTTSMLRQTWTTRPTMCRPACQTSLGMRATVPSACHCVLHIHHRWLPSFHREVVRCRYLTSDLGFEGIRFDYSRGYGAKYAALYARAGLSDDQLAVGEYWIPLDYDDKGKMLPNQEGHRKRVCKWLDEAERRCLAFDFGTKGLLQVCMSRVACVACARPSLCWRCPAQALLAQAGDHEPHGVLTACCVCRRQSASRSTTGWWIATTVHTGSSVFVLKLL